MRENVSRSSVHTVWPAASIGHHLAEHGPPATTTEELGAKLRELVRAGLDELPLPGDGQTMERWRALAAVAAHDLGLAALYESHTDALAILAELRGPAPLAHTTWGVWAAEPPAAKVIAVREPDGRARLTGRKAWCSGATVLSHALVTAWIEPDEQCLVAVPLTQDSIRIHTGPWQAVGMGATGSVDVEFNDTWGSFIGGRGEYVSRPGFWHGGAGIAACWYGGATAIAEALRESVAARAEPHAAAHLGAVDVALASAAAVLRDAAAHIDAAPDANVAALALRVRETVERAATNVVQHVSRALGAGPLCRDARVARHIADLPIFVQQSHAERDLTHLGVAVANLAAGSWAL
jgi:alkylation response protein AidB-like acyl-CoA dehydrogenase